jgi:hypothetical protein
MRQAPAKRRLELTIPYRGIVLGEPLPKAGQVFLWEALDGHSDVGHGGHGDKATPANDPAQLDRRRPANGLVTAQRGLLALSIGDQMGNISRPSGWWLRRASREPTSGSSSVLRFTFLPA